MVNISTTALLQRLNVDKSIYFQEYILLDGETPEMVAYKLYKRVDYHWVILILNNIINPYTDWYIASEVFDLYVDNKYKLGVSNLPDSMGIGGINHFKHKFSGRILNDKEDLEARFKYHQDPLSIGDNIIPVTNYEHEKSLNLQKQTLQVVNPRYIDNFVESYLTMFNSDT